MEEELTNARNQVVFLMKHARAKNKPEALPLTNALACLNEALEIVRRSDGVANNVINPTTK